MAHLHKILQQTKQKINKKIFYISKEITMKIANHKAHKELSKDEKINIYLDILFKVSF